MTTTDRTTSGIEDPRERLVQWASLYRKTIPGTYRWLVNAGVRQTPAQRCEATRLRAAKVPATVGDLVWDGLLAATTEYACETVGIAPPAWCKAEAFRGPDEQWYAEEETERARSGAGRRGHRERDARTPSGRHAGVLPAAQPRHQPGKLEPAAGRLSMAGRKIGELDEWRHRVGVHSAYLHHVRVHQP